MNFLAHIYLTDKLPLETIGNFMADGIKGKKYLKYGDEIQKGILIHRWIDSYTDSHSIVKQSTKRLHAKYGHYSGVIVDILYDHFLAKNWSHYHDTNNMNIRTKRRVAMDEAIFELKEYYTEFEEEFTSFFKQLDAFVKEKLVEINESYR